MDYVLKQNRTGYWEIRWSERTPDGGWRSKSVSTRTTDRGIAETVRRNFVRAEAQEAARGAGDGSVTVASVLDGYSLAAKARRVGASQLMLARVVRDYLGALTLDEITPELIAGYQSRRGVSNGTARRELGVLATALRWGRKNDRLGGARMPEIELPPGGEPRAMFLDQRVEEELWELASRDTDGRGRLSRIARFICVGLSTGARKSAIEKLTWDRVDLSRQIIDFRDPEMRVTKKRRVATPINSRLLPVLERAARERRARDAFVLDHGGSVRAPWATFMTKHGFERVTPHILRHTRITLLLQAGVTIWDVSALVGASPGVIQQVYGHHVADNRLRAEAERRVALVG